MWAGERMGRNSVVGGSGSSSFTGRAPNAQMIGALVHRQSKKKKLWVSPSVGDVWLGCAAQRFNLKATDDDHLQLNGCCSVWCCLCLPQCSTLTRIEGTNNFKSGGKGDPLSFASADAMMPDNCCCGNGPKCTNTKKHPDTTRTFPPCM